MPTGRASKVESWLPLCYFAAAVVLVLTLLPTVLRPPQSPPTQSAELSPDAPPDDEQQAIISALNRASSGTAGQGEGNGPGADVLDDGASPTPLSRTAPRGCRFGFGDPPRQTRSLYSAPCRPPCPTADKPGSKGVSASEITVAVGHPGFDLGTEGPVTPSRSEGMNTADRTWTDMQQWINSRYDLCGRQLQMHVVNGGQEPTEMAAVAARIDEEIGAFAAVYGRYELMAETARRRIVTFGEQLDTFSEAFYSANRPYLWNWTASSTQLLGLSAEYACKKLLGRNADFAGPGLQGQPRKFAIIYNTRNGPGGSVEDEFRTPFSQCGGTVAVAVGFGEGNDGPTAATATVARLQQDGITTVIAAADFINMGGITNQGAATGYFPEYVVTGVGNTDFPMNARVFQNQEAWTHAFGITTIEMEHAQAGLTGNLQESDCYTAVAEVDPGFTPEANVCLLFPSLLQLANGIQGAGPDLSPQTFEQAMYRTGLRAPLPRWSIGGGYGPTQHAYPVYAGEIWYDRDAVDAQGSPGNYRWTNRGRKATFGEFDTDVSQLFTSGIVFRRDAEG